jgi:predicted nucleic acid-binding protein
MALVVDTDVASFLARRRGRPVAMADAWVAATALFLDVPLVTNNESHFSSVTGLTVISEKNP